MIVYCASPIPDCVSDESGSSGRFDTVAAGCVVDGASGAEEQAMKDEPRTPRHNTTPEPTLRNLNSHLQALSTNEDGV